MGTRPAAHSVQALAELLTCSGLSASCPHYTSSAYQLRGEAMLALRRRFGCEISSKISGSSLTGAGGTADCSRRLFGRVLAMDNAARFPHAVPRSRAGSWRSRMTRVGPTVASLVLSVIRLRPQSLRQSVFQLLFGAGPARPTSNSSPSVLAGRSKRDGPSAAPGRAVRLGPALGTVTVPDRALAGNAPCWFRRIAGERSRFAEA